MKSYSTAAQESATFEAANDATCTAHRKAWRMSDWSGILQMGISLPFLLGLFVYLIHLWFAQAITVGEIVLLMSLAQSISNELRDLGHVMQSLFEAIAESTEMMEILLLPPSIQDTNAPPLTGPLTGDIVFQDIAFHYANGKTIFTGLNLKIPAGQRVGLVGHSGSGKSTLTKLLMRFVEHQHGTITLGGQHISHLRQEDLRQQISYVPQEPLLFHRTVYENIAYGSPQASQEAVVAAAKKAHAHEFIEALPEGYDSLVGERGVKLSGGERQRIAIARAMLKQAPVLILDEATSSLDTVSERYIQASFAALMEGRTTIVIAHRLSTIQQMNRIIVLEEGQVVEDGSPQELLEKKGLYARLCAHQQDGFLVD